jgi:hypothetical protein
MIRRLVLLLALFPAVLAAQSTPTLPFSLKGYLQFRYNRLLETNDALTCSSCDRSIGGMGGLAIRRARIGFQANPSARSSMYIQWDLSTDPSAYAQMRDAWVDVYGGANRELRVRLGQHVIPTSVEALQSSSVRVPFDRSDALNSGLPNERDIGITVSFTPKPVKDLWSDLQKRAQKGAGDHGIIALSVYNGQTSNKAERNRSQHGNLRIAYPFQLGGQVLELGGSAFAGRFVMDPATVTAGVTRSIRGYDDRRAALSAVLYPRPFGLTAEWVTGEGPEYDPATNAITQSSLEGGYVLASLRRPAGQGWVTPFVRGQWYEGGKKTEQDARRFDLTEYETGIEWQVDSQLEFTASWVTSDRRFEDGGKPSNRQEGSFLRLQAQVIY